MSGPDPAAPRVDDPSHDAEPVGSVAQEAFKLFRAVTSQADAGSQPAGDHTTGDQASHDHTCSTSWCPVCQVVGFVRDNPDAIASVTRSATDLARSLRDLVETALTPEEKK
ncbi:hypothetical protein [Aeromicrobium endophyticum]|uniref:Uncharacterized protein n=1 Tax=Aeromicrobium endophyticum TaxID=2292704 RepID=A0A371P4E3_9ACTN|nr:hypothetical protein [Aeromicrobium endophyticum]REK70428.1 hypothetical protein DX116_14915 [Aeromicrobium endophyticum]